jgi:hypothetical protein
MGNGSHCIYINFPLWEKSKLCKTKTEINLNLINILIKA